MSPGDSTGMDEVMQFIWEDPEFFRMAGTFRILPNKKVIACDIKEKVYQQSKSNNSMLKNLAYPAATKPRATEAIVSRSVRNSAQFVIDSRNEASRGPGYNMTVPRRGNSVSAGQETATEEKTREEKETEEPKKVCVCVVVFMTL